MDYWLAWVTVAPVCPKKGHDTIIDGVSLEGGKDAYLEVQYLEYVEVRTIITCNCLTPHVCRTLAMEVGSS